MTQPYLVRILSKYNVSEGTVLGTLPYYMGMIDPVVMIALRCHDSRLNASSVQEVGKQYHVVVYPPDVKYAVD